jgi:hypothetical protein
VVVAAAADTQELLVVAVVAVVAELSVQQRLIQSVQVQLLLSLLERVDLLEMVEHQRLLVEAVEQQQLSQVLRLLFPQMVEVAEKKDRIAAANSHSLVMVATQQMETQEVQTIGMAPAAVEAAVVQLLERIQVAHRPDTAIDRMQVMEP